VEIRFIHNVIEINNLNINSGLFHKM